MTVNRQWILTAKPQGLTDAEHLELRAGTVADPSEDEVLLKVIYISIEPGQQFLMASTEDVGGGAVKVGDVPRAWAVGRVVVSRSANGKEAQLSHPHIVHNAVRPSTVAFLRLLAHEVAADGVTVNVVAPGLTATPTLMNYIADKMQITPEQGLDWLAGKPVEGIQGGQGPADISMRRAGQPEEVGATVAFFASQLAGYITASWIAVDGGRHHYTF